ncbi:Hydroxymethylglutaryl- synthase protein [Rutstroemia sp. NJR-2017a WRK4]|nr:Hydroxymethylglutaryl- synthase protein [Rutstroemia sp. NJR-2017a WRK4]
MSSRPQNIGIKAIEIYFPSQCVDQAELEKFDGVSQGKYTIGLGQTKMSFCDDTEDLTSEYPIVDGHFSIKCYLEAVDACYKAYNKREGTLKALANGHANGNGAEEASSKTPLDRFDYLAFHAPTCKLVAKSYARLLYNDYLANPSAPAFADVPAELRDMDYTKSLSDKVVEKTFMGLTKKRFNERVQPSIEVPTMCGNMYSASVYGGLVSLLSNIDSASLQGKRIAIFSYGSGLASSLFSVKVAGSTEHMSKALNLKERLAARRTVAPEVYDQMCELRKKAHLQKSYTPAGSPETIAKDTYYLISVDDMFRRKYEVKA